MKYLLPRRHVLNGLGVLGLGVLARPLLSEAQGVTPQRLLIIHRPVGTRPEHWFPTVGGLKDWQTTPLLSPFDAVRQDMVVMKGIDTPRSGDWPGDEHAAGLLSIVTPPPSLAIGFDNQALPGQSKQSDACWFTSGARSVDQELQANVAAFGGARFPSVQLGSSLGSMQGNSPEARACLSFSGAHLPLWPESRPDVAFTNLFGGVMTGGVDAALAERIRLRNKSVLDFAIQDLSDLRTRLPASQFAKLDSHLTAIRALEIGMVSTTVGCEQPGLSALPDQGDRHVLASQQQMALIKATFACDLTRVITMTFGQGNSEEAVSQFPNVGANADGLHSVSHGDDPEAHRIQEAADKFYCDTTAKLLLDLKNTPEGGGNMLDNTLVVYFSDVMIGSAHSIEDNPVLLFGGKFLGLQGGSFLQFTGRTFADVWVETFRRLNLNTTQWGAPDWNRGALPGLYA